MIQNQLEDNAKLTVKSPVGGTARETVSLGEIARGKVAMLANKKETFNR